MKKVIILLVLLNTTLFSQIIVNDVSVSGIGSQMSEIEQFQSNLIEKLSKSFYVLDRSLGDYNKEIDLTRIRDYFKSSIDPNFEPAAYFLKLNFKRTVGFTEEIIDISASVKEVNSSIMYSVSGRAIDIKDLDDACEYVYNFIINRISTYYPIINSLDDKHFIIRYGTDRGAEDSNEFEILSLDDDIQIGEAEISNSSSKTSICKINNLNSNQKVNRNNYTKYYVRTKVDFKKSYHYSEKLLSLGRNTNDYRKFEKNDWFLFTAETFEFSNQIFKPFADRKLIKPMVFGLQYNFYNHDFRIFLKGRIGYSFIPTAFENKSSNLVFYHLGGGFESQFRINNFLTPRFSGGVYYIHSSIENPLNNIETNNTLLNGINCELKAGLMLRISNIGLYGEVGYHIMPYLKDIMGNNFSGTAISAGLGLSVFVN